MLGEQEPDAGAPKGLGAGEATPENVDPTSTGIAECDAYLRQYACYLDKLAPGESARRMPSIRDGYVQSARVPAARNTAAASCVMQLATMEQTFARSGCSAEDLSPDGEGGARSAASSARIDRHDAHGGKCHRGDCVLRDEYCCENTNTAEERCQPRATRQGKSYACSHDGAWRIAMGCLQYDGCEGGEKCCILEPVRGFFQTACAVDCGGGEESCTGRAGDGACKTTGTVCVANPGSRSGGHCVSAGDRAPQTARAPARCGACEGPSATNVCVPLCDDDQHCVDDDCAD